MMLLTSEASESEFSDDSEPAAELTAGTGPRTKRGNRDSRDQGSDGESVEDESDGEPEDEGQDDDSEDDEEFDEEDFSGDEDTEEGSEEESSDDKLDSKKKSPTAMKDMPKALLGSSSKEKGKKSLSEAGRGTKEGKPPVSKKDTGGVASVETGKSRHKAKVPAKAQTEDSDEGSFCDESDNSKERDTSPAAGAKKQSATSADGTWEDIYGRLRDKDGNVVSQKYVPPAKRLQGTDVSSKKKEELARLKKQVKGLLNRLSEATVQPIGMEMEELYKKHSNNDVNSTLLLCLCESLIAPFLTPERLVMEHAMLVAYLHCNVGPEVGAQILQDMAEKFDDLCRQQQGHDAVGKEVDNCALFISYLFMFKVVHSRIVYDLIRKMAETFTEKDVEVILLILRSVGFALRKHDPLALKEAVLLLQQKSAQDTAGAQDSRKRFMLEILTAVRNNNIQKIPNCDPSMAEHASKVLRGLFRKGNFLLTPASFPPSTGCSLQELNISLEDLLKAHERGKWWVVGSAWVGSDQPSEKKSDAPSQQPQFSSKILKLAQKHHMNTDVRRNIFCILMTAEDYLSASERILHLNLSATQEREMCHVLLHCLLKEKQHNPYYAYVAQFFVKRDRRFYMSLQCAVWDKFKEVDQMSQAELSNLAEFLVILLCQEALSLAVLKNVQFVDMSPGLLQLLQQLFGSLLLSRPQDVSQRVFLKVAEAPKLRLLREGLCLFLRHFFLKDRHDLDPAALKTLQQRAGLAEETLTRGDKKALI
ncbi:hypothetical protein HPB48_002475 [Haemaphysalis longicornis]|uniref:MI domain-containing protein n=1 Tax=Haemaphysalis longicornis TaxID=44386 RepID=A0A9J6G514_HAELO|nr:hypothetical protein HPB48_002475 [Haemaphysalis longicornis]